MIEINPEDWSVRIELPAGEVTVEGLPPGSPVQLGTGRAVFLDPEEARTLERMVGYNLTQIAGGSLRVREGSEQVLREVQGRLREAFEIASGEGAE